MTIELLNEWLRGQRLALIKRYLSEIVDAQGRNNDLACISLEAKKTLGYQAREAFIAWRECQVSILSELKP